MGISRPSLYAAFGNKEGLFLKVLDHYRETAAAYLTEALKKPSALEVFDSLLHGAIDLQAGGENPTGCLFVNGALACDKDSMNVREELSLRRIAGELAIRERFERAISEGDLPKKTDARSLARYVATLLHGLAIQAVNGDSVEDLHLVAEIARRSFPISEKKTRPPQNEKPQL
jgi:AcrR family transcriptional regulator